uniref:Peptidase A2 domain-containing protein n=1 Tax=Trichogramma kaykai TaxID=54128 RepID=A0ABD2WDV1_9HYME
MLLQEGKLISLPLKQAPEIHAGSDARLHVSDKSDNILFLVDSGLSVPLLRKAHSPKPLMVQPLTLYAVNHSPIATYGTLKKTLNLGLRRDFQCEFTIADVPLAILGADFLARHGLLSNCKNQEIIDSLTGLRAKGPLSRTYTLGFDAGNSRGKYRRSTICTPRLRVFRPF